MYQQLQFFWVMCNTVMNVFAGSVIFFLCTTLTGVLVYYIVHHSYAIGDTNTSIDDINSSVKGIKSNILKDEASNDGSFVTMAQAILTNQSQTDKSVSDISDANTHIASTSAAFTALTSGLKTNLQTNRMSLNTPTTSNLGDTLSVSTTAPSASTTAPTDGTKWLSVTDKNSTNYANLGVGSMWADKGVSMAKGSCIDFGNGATVCGNQTGFVSGSSVGTPLGLTIKGAPAAEKKNASALPTSLPGDTDSQKKNRIVGDTIITADVAMGGNTSIGNTAAVGMGMLSSANGSHVYSGMDSSTAPATMSLGFAHRPTDGTLPSGGSDLVRLTRTQNVGNSVKILGNLQICDDSGKNCQTVVGSPNAPAGPAPPFLSDTATYSVWTP